MFAFFTFWEEEHLLEKVVEEEEGKGSWVGFLETLVRHIGRALQAYGVL